MQTIVCDSSRKHLERKGMTTTAKTTTEDLQAQILASIRKSQAAAVDVLRTWTEATERLVPRTAPWPGADRYPTPAELVDSAYDFAAELLKAQRDFAHKALQATAPLYDRIEEQSDKATSRAKS
jgi:hypothetical protein